MRSIPDSKDPDGQDIIPLTPGLNLNQEGFNVIERRVRKLVEVLWKLRYETVCSCAGHMDGLEPYPWVLVIIDSRIRMEMLGRLVEATARFNLNLGTNGIWPPVKMTWTLVPMETRGKELGIFLKPSNENTLRRPGILSNLRDSADDLASFLERDCKDVFEV